MSLQALDRQGFALAPNLATAKEIATLIAFFDTANMARTTRGGETFGARNLLAFAAVQDIAASTRIAECLTPLLGPDYRAVRGLFFDKTANANWPVLWHQDLSLAVRERCDLPGWINWSVKQGVPHVQPPAEVLARMVTMRLHLDDCGPDNGPLRVLPGSHSEGLLNREAIRARTTNGGIAVLAQAGDALFMRPLILHASSPAIRPHHRRVLHLEFAPAGLLPPELAWAA
jgi:ectoine hydroxylase-related dioxygenase (phytanoyl-CoA dioxygenase family)